MMVWDRAWQWRAPGMCNFLRRYASESPLLLYRMAGSECIRFRGTNAENSELRSECLADRRFAV